MHSNILIKFSKFLLDHQILEFSEFSILLKQWHQWLELFFFSLPNCRSSWWTLPYLSYQISIISLVTILPLSPSAKLLLPLRCPSSRILNYLNFSESLISYDPKTGSFVGEFLVLQQYLRICAYLLIYFHYYVALFLEFWTIYNFSGTCIHRDLKTWSQSMNLLGSLK